MAYETATLTGTYLLLDGTPAKGRVEIIPNSREIVDANGDKILSGRVKVDLDADGYFSVVLPATDDETLQPAADRQYTVVAKLHHASIPAVEGIEIPGGTTLDMADAVELTGAAAAYSYTAPAFIGPVTIDGVPLTPFSVIDNGDGTTSIITGNTVIDGGFPDSTYNPAQIIDGGEVVA